MLFPEPLLVLVNTFFQLVCHPGGHLYMLDIMSSHVYRSIDRYLSSVVMQQNGLIEKMLTASTASASDCFFLLVFASVLYV